MHRLEELRNEIYFYLESAPNKEKNMVAEHLFAVSNLCSLLALRRGLDITLCAASGMLHDLWVLQAGNTENHAQHSAHLAKEVLEAFRSFNDDDIAIIVNAIKNHTNKGEEHDGYSEALKDADVLHRYLVDPNEKFSKSKAQRIKNSLRELGINVKVKKK